MENPAKLSPIVDASGVHLQDTARSLRLRGGKHGQQTQMPSRIQIRRHVARRIAALEGAPGGGG